MLRASDVAWLAMQTLVYPFAEAGRLHAAVDAGLRGVVAVIHALDRAGYERLHGAGTFDAFEAGLGALEAAPLERAAHLVVTGDGWEETLAALLERGWRLEEVSVLEGAADPARVEAATGVAPRVL